MDEPLDSPVDEAAQPVGPVKMAARIIGGILVMLTIVAIASLVWLLVGNSTGIGRFVVALLMSVVIGWFGIGYFRQLAHAPPADQEPMHVDPSLRLTYVCEICGMELAVIVAAKERAPRHCSEAMVLIRKR